MRFTDEQIEKAAREVAKAIYPGFDMGPQEWKAHPHWVKEDCFRAARAALEAVMPEGADPRPADCRFRLQDEGKGYPRSSCKACTRTITSGLGNRCALERTEIPGTHPAPEPGELERLRTEVDFVRHERDAYHQRLSEVMTERNTLRAENERLRDTLEWYEGMLAGVWKDNLWGEASRLILANDRGHRARTALAEGGRDE